MGKYQKLRPEVHRVAVIKYQEHKPEAHRIAESKYQQNNIDIHRAAVSNYQKVHPQVHRLASSKHQNSNPIVHKSAQSLYERNNPGLRSELRLRPLKTKANSGFTYEPDLAYSNDIGRMESTCLFCSAKNSSEKLRFMLQ